MHLFSNPMPLPGTIIVAVIYTLNTVLPVLLQTYQLSRDNYPSPKLGLYIGLITYIIGMYGNFYHHYKLRTLRLHKMKENNGKKVYIIPNGGLFDYCWTPHYLFEIIDFFGIAITSKYIISYYQAFGYASYLIGRAYSTKKWYLNKFDPCPNRAAILPFVY